MTLAFVALAGVLLLGFLVGRWWFAIVAAVAVGAFVALTADTDVPSASLGLLSAAVTFVALSLLTLLRQALRSAGELWKMRRRDRGSG